MNVKDRMQSIINEGQKNLQETLTSIDNEFEIRQDQMVKNSIIDIIPSKGELQIAFGQRNFKVTPHSEQQIYSHYGIPRTYAQKLSEWDLDDLLQNNFEQITKARFDNDKVLIRSVGDKIKGWLSPSFKRIDASPILNSFKESCLNEGMVPIKAFNTDSRYQLRFAYPEVLIPAGIERESCLFGTSLTTGDYGGSAFKFEIMVVRMACLNGMLGAVLWRQVHLGSRFLGWNDIEMLSNTTLSLDVRTIASGMNDLIRTLPAKREEIKSKIEGAFTKQPSAAAWESIKKATDKKTYEQIENFYNSELEVELLPKEKSVWKLANAVSLIAQDMGNADERIDMETLAMKLVA